MTKKLKLGQTGRDKITGFRGVITGRCKYLSGCSQLLLIPTVDKDGEMRDGQWIDEQRIEAEPCEMRVRLNNEKTPGADIAPPRRT